MHYLAIDSWNRKDLFEYFRTFDNPFFNVCTEVEIDPFLEFVTQNDLSFSLACLFASLKAANETAPLRFRLDDDKVAVYDRIDIGNTILNEDETFSFCYFTYDPDFSIFYKNAWQVLKTHRKKRGQLRPGNEQKNLIHSSTLPWFKFTGFSHSRNYGTDDSIPKFVFGKYFDDGGGTKLPFSIEVHHALVDGIHVAHFLERFQNILNNPDQNMGS